MSTALGSCAAAGVTAEPHPMWMGAEAFRRAVGNLSPDCLRSSEDTVHFLYQCVSYKEITLHWRFSKPALFHISPKKIPRPKLSHSWAKVSKLPQAEDGRKPDLSSSSTQFLALLNKICQ